jgi:small subunit ribosomal protein S5
MIKKGNSNTKEKFKEKRKEKSEYEQKVIDIARVTRVVKGGKRFSFRTTVVIGNKKGKVGVGVAKGPDMKISTEKSFANAKKNLITVNLKGNTIPYQVYQKFGSAKIILKPAIKGRGIVAGGAVRTVVNLAGISDITGKMLGSKNKLSNARATIEALKQFSVKKIRETLRETLLKKEKEKETKEKEDVKTKILTNKKVKTDSSKKISKAI